MRVQLVGFRLVLWVGIFVVLTGNSRNHYGKQAGLSLRLLPLASFSFDQFLEQFLDICRIVRCLLISRSVEDAIEKALHHFLDLLSLVAVSLRCRRSAFENILYHFLELLSLVAAGLRCRRSALRNRIVWPPA